MDVSREQLIDQVRQLATPIDFHSLIASGALAEPVGGWYRLKDMQLLPVFAWQQVAEIKGGPAGDGTAHSTYLKFTRSNKAAAKLYEDLTGQSFHT